MDIFSAFSAPLFALDVLAALLLLPALVGATVSTDWIEVFKAGDYPQGEFSAEDIQSIADNYDPESVFEAPGSVDHRQQGFAYGWVSDLKAEAGRLYAKFRQVPEAFAKAIKEGRVKNRSIELFRDFQGKDLYLKAVSWLGVKPPQVTGMEDPAGAIEQFDHSGYGSYATFDEATPDEEAPEGERDEEESEEEPSDEAPPDEEESDGEESGEEESGEDDTDEEDETEDEQESDGEADDSDSDEDTEEFSREAQSEIERLRRQNRQLQEQMEGSERDQAIEEFEAFCEERVPPSIRSEVLAIFEALHEQRDTLSFSHEEHDGPLEAFRSVVGELSLAHLFDFEPEAPDEDGGTSPRHLEDAVRENMSGAA
jgi:hypothetical protein